MKKILAAILCLSMVFSLLIPACAFEDIPSTHIITLDNGLEVTETTTPENQIIRTFENNIPVLFSASNTQSTSISTTDIEKVLLALGFIEEEIENMSDADLSLYASCPRIQVSSSYCAVAPDGSVSPITKEQAIQGIDTANNLATQNDASESGEVTTSYMYLYFTAIDLNDGNGSFRFGTTAQWLTMPIFRGRDALGSCAQLFTVTPGTQQGFYSYIKETYTNNVLTSTLTNSQTRTSLGSSSFKNATDGTFYGTGAFFRLGEDINAEPLSVKYKNYIIHVQHDGKVNHPDLRNNLNATGTYIHTTIHFSIEPSLTIDTSRTVGGALGVSATLFPEPLDIPLEINYVP